MPEVSVIIPTYNVEAFILETVNSVFEQSFANWEILIIDDCSTDLTAKILKDNFSLNPKVRLFLNNENRGSGFCRNLGIAEASGRYIAFLDSDDVWYKEKLSLQLEFMKRHNSPISHTAYGFFDSKGGRLPGRIRVSNQVGLLDNLKRTEIGTSTAIIDTNMVGADFRFSDIRARQDLVLWVDLMSLGFYSNGMDLELVKYRVRGGSVSSNKLKMLWVTLRVYLRFKKLPLYQRVYCYFLYVFNAIRKRV